MCKRGHRDDSDKRTWVGCDGGNADQRASLASVARVSPASWAGLQRRGRGVRGFTPRDRASSQPTSTAGRLGPASGLRSAPDPRIESAVRRSAAREAEGPGCEPWCRPQSHSVPREARHRSTSAGANRRGFADTLRVLANSSPTHLNTTPDAVLSDSPNRIRSM